MINTSYRKLGVQVSAPLFWIEKQPLFSWLDSNPVPCPHPQALLTVHGWELSSAGRQSPGQRSCSTASRSGSRGLTPLCTGVEREEIENSKETHWTDTKQTSPGRLLQSNLLNITPGHPLLIITTQTEYTGCQWGLIISYQQPYKWFIPSKYHFGKLKHIDSHVTKFSTEMISI